MSINMFKCTQSSLLIFKQLFYLFIISSVILQTLGVVTKIRYGNRERKIKETFRLNDKVYKAPFSSSSLTPRAGFGYSSAEPYENETPADEGANRNIKTYSVLRKSSSPSREKVSKKKSFSSEPVDYCLKSRGQFAYPMDCSSYVNCWDSTAFIQQCFPKYLIFNPITRRCDFSSNVPRSARNCGKRFIQTEDISSSTLTDNHLSSSRTVPEEPNSKFCTDFEHIGLECVPQEYCHNGIIVKESQGTSHTANRIFYGGEPELKICNGHGDICCKNANFRKGRSPDKAQPSLCPSDYTGSISYENDCRKFINCWKGISKVQSCAPGTLYNSASGICDFPSKSDCGTPASLIKNSMRKNTDYDDNDEDEEEEISRSGGNKVLPAPPTSGQTIRLRGGKAPYTGYLEMFRNDKWGFVCDEGSWTIQEANLGLIHGGINEERKMTESVECSGGETSLDKCKIRYSTPGNRYGSCKPSSNIVSITCVHDSLASCKTEGEVPWGESCYSVHTKEANFHEAQSICKGEGKTLLEITSQRENDLVSELLLHNKLSSDLLGEVWTGGLASKTKRSASYIWHGSSTFILFQNWWPGWDGRRTASSKNLYRANAKGIKFSRKFPFIESSLRRRRDLRLTDYYFWTLEDFSIKLPFICESKKNDIGCIIGNGDSYEGSATRGESGVTCLPWKSPFLTTILDKENINKLGPLQDNNFCRNPDGDIGPWCIAPNGEFDYCDIPTCPENAEIHSDQKIIKHRCPPGHFQCQSGAQCILKEYVCDGHEDCINGADEKEIVCSENIAFKALEDFNKYSKNRLYVAYTERWLDVNVEACARHCLEAGDFVCRSFNYHHDKRLCTLNEEDIGSMGMKREDPEWDYYQNINTGNFCENEELTCPSGKCLKENEICDGKSDCSDNYDERDCSDKPNVEIRLIGGKAGPHEGRIEIKAFDYPFGGICDDGFNIGEANVVCKSLGYSLGASNETSILNCKFDPWTQHDCSNKEWAGVRCKISQKECEPEEWRCNDSQECIPLDLLCDGEPDCVDGSDESLKQCKTPIELRLVNGNNMTSGRVEVLFKGVWGTVCDDNFGEAEGGVVCRNLGFKNHEALIHGQAAFEAGEGPIWIESIQCEGTESSLKECHSSSWSPSYRCKHMEDVGLECIPKEDSDKGIDRTRFDPFFKVECGKSLIKDSDLPSEPIARVAGGRQSKPGYQPWVASVRVQGSSNSYHWCGAVILSEFHVLTVGHCMEDYPKDVYKVRVGDWDMEVPDVQEQEFSIEDVHFHEEYNMNKYLNNDIALIRIKPNRDESGIKFGSRVVPICLPTKKCSLLSQLGVHYFRLGIHEYLGTRIYTVAKIPYLETSKCINPRVYGEKKLSNGMFCAGFLDGGVDSCQGDSGGGLICKTGENSSALLGLTSWGYGCGRPNRPGVYTKVVNYLDWIQERMTL
ncbi:SVH1 [Lepeophtheirus salmonis]|uniref:SVH1 n=1 Tax=Lepeophtheirus salmonis TaxID=72036 RepID=A0A7R8CWT2_LEPSM|nr:SVH1 [Lepeophtheirus salmonis]CAF2906734.1 SVH1 [Lepeophtheirus salmonis]